MPPGACLTTPADELVTLARELRKIHTIPCGGKGLQLQVPCTQCCTVAVNLGVTPACRSQRLQNRS